MGKEVDFDALAAMYIWEHLKKLNMGAPILRRWRSADLQIPVRKTVLFTMPFFLPVSMVEKDQEEIELPVAILTEDGILRYLVGISGMVDLKQHHSHCIG